MKQAVMSSRRFALLRKHCEEAGLSKEEIELEVSLATDLGAPADALYWDTVAKEWAT